MVKIEWKRTMSKTLTKESMLYVAPMQHEIEPVDIIRLSAATQRVQIFLGLIIVTNLMSRNSNRSPKQLGTQLDHARNPQFGSPPPGANLRTIGI